MRHGRLKFSGGGMSPGSIGLLALFVVLAAAVGWGYTSGSRGDAVQPAATAVAPTTAKAQPAALPAGPVASPAPVADVAPAVAPPQPSPAAVVREDAPAPNRGVRGVVKAKDEVLFSSKIAARIARMPFKEGERFEKGALLVGFDCSRLRAEANAAWAANRASRQIHRQNVELDTYNAIGKTEVQVAQAKVEQTAAEATALESQVHDCTISAPFSGIVVENIAHEHETAAAGAQLTRVLNDSELEVHLIAPSPWLSWLKPGSTFRFKVDETGRTHAGRVVRLGASVDPVSQTVRVVGRFTDGREAVLPGMSGSAEFAQATPAAQRQSP